MKNYLTLWDEGPPNDNSGRLTTPVTVIGEQISATKSEFAKVQLTAHPADTFEVLDHVKERDELEKLGVGWPDPVIFGLLDVLMSAGPVRLQNVRIVLEQVWYHEVDSTRSAFRYAGRDAGRKIVEAVKENSPSPD